jgi:enamine deaminase RidA (YjgF/YER057c/UK114 family)
MMVTPQLEGTVTDQVWEAISTLRAILKQQPVSMTVTSQTVFLRNAEDAAVCRALMEAYFGSRMPATTFVVQAPCGGQALAIEAWAIGGPNVEIAFLSPDVVEVAYDGMRWVHFGGIVSPSTSAAYSQSAVAFDELSRRLATAGTSMNDVVRVWLYQGGITQTEGDIERYRELNRARTDFFQHEEAQGRMHVRRGERSFYPASTGIGTAGRGLALCCLSLQTRRKDVRLQPLENPLQISAFQYAARFSPQSPKFSRAMAVIIGDYVTTWISGTASILNSETVHFGDVVRQTEQALDNIESLISAENFERHGMAGAGATLHDLAKIRVYVKRTSDYEQCRAVCERRLGAIPAIYAQADICRSNLLVEIEGVAFTPLRGTAVRKSGDCT